MHGCLRCLVVSDLSARIASVGGPKRKAGQIFEYCETIEDSRLFNCFYLLLDVLEQQHAVAIGYWHKMIVPCRYNVHRMEQENLVSKAAGRALDQRTGRPEDWLPVQRLVKLYRAGGAEDLEATVGPWHCGCFLPNFVI
jgi:hypothetical protein